MKTLQLPLSESDVRSLKLGESVQITGVIFTARDAAHGYFMSHPALEEPSPALSGGVIYHCGPVIVKDGDGWRVTACGPTTSSREDPYEPAVIERFGLRGIIGKGGMGPDTVEACRRFGCVYFQAPGGAAQVLAAAVRRVRGVYYYEQFGAPEAIWELEVRDFPLTVTIDAHGNSLHEQVREDSRKRLDALL